jgi:hypothetical protein
MDMGRNPHRQCVQVPMADVKDSIVMTPVGRMSSGLSVHLETSLLALKDKRACAH